MKVLKYGLIDAAKHQGWGAIIVPSGTTMAQAVTFVQSLGTLSDAEVLQVVLEEKTIYTPDLLLAGEHGSEERGTVHIQRITDGVVFKVGIPAVSQDFIDLNGQMPEKVSDIACTSTVSFLATVLGLTPADLRVLRAPITILKH